MKIAVKVIANAKKNEILELGYNDNNIKLFKIRINKIAHQGKANQELIKILAKYFCVKKNDIMITSGLTSCNKIIEINNL